MRRNIHALGFAAMAALLTRGQSGLAASEPHITNLADGEASAGEGPFHATAVIPGIHNDLWIASEGQGVWNLRAARLDTIAKDRAQFDSNIAKVAGAD